MKLTKQELSSLTDGNDNLIICMYLTFRIENDTYIQSHNYRSMDGRYYPLRFSFDIDWNNIKDGRIAANDIKKLFDKELLTHLKDHSVQIKINNSTALTVYDLDALYNCTVKL